MALDLGTLRGFLELDDQKFDDVLDKMPGKLKGSGVIAGIAAGLVAAGIGTAISDGIANAIELDKAQHQITAQLGLGAEESARIGGIAGKLYADAYGESVQDVSNAVQNVVSSIDGMRDATEEAVSDMTAKALNFASAFEIDTARSTQVVGQLIKSGLVADANEGFDLMTAAMQKVPAAMREDILDALDEYGPFLQSLGITGEQAFTVLADGAAKGMYGIDKSGDALKEFTIRAVDMSKSTTGVYDALGLSSQDMTNRILAGGDSARGAMAEIVAGLQSMTDPGAQASAAIALFGTPLEDLGTSEIPTFLDSLANLQGGLGDTVGAADRMGAALNGSASVKWTELSRTWDSIVGQLGAALLPALELVLDVLNQNPMVLQSVAVALGLLALAFVGVTVATWAMNTALLANPITWIILGIVALIAGLVLLVANWDTVVKFLGDAWAGFIGWFTGIMDGFLGWWGGVWDGFVGFLTDAWNGAVAWVASIPQMIGDALAGLGQMLMDLGMNALQNFATVIALGIMAVIYYFTQFPTDVWNALVGIGTWLLQTGNDLMAGLWNGIVAGWNATVAWFNALPAAIQAFLVTAGVWLIVHGLALLQGLQSGITNGWNAVVGFFTGIPGAVARFFTGVGVWLVTTGRDLLGGFLNGVTGFWGSVVGWFQGIPGMIMGQFSGIGGWLYSAGRDLVNGLLRGVSSLAGTIGNFFIGLLPGWIVGPFKAALGIASPSKVFRGFGRNIGEGLLLGLDDEQAAIDDRLGSLAMAPDGVQGGQSAGAGGVGGSGATVDRSVHIHGNVGWSPEELEARMREEDRRAQALEGLDTLVGVA